MNSLSLSLNLKQNEPFKNKLKETETELIKYTNEQDVSLNTKLKTTETELVKYIDEQDGSLNTKLKTTETELLKHIDDQDKSFKSTLKTTETELVKYIDDQDFVNLKPIIGLEGEKQIELAINGLQITFPEKIIFLGGYCSTFKSQTYMLNANKTNYIYLIRNNDRHIIDILNTATPIGSEANVVTFNRILIAKFITNNNSVTSMLYFQI